jgi:acylaminoacyl-peptidase
MQLVPLHFGGVSWSAREGRIVYVAEASPPDLTPEWGMGVTVTAAAAADKTKDKTQKDEAPTKAGGSNKKGWRGQGEWREEWGEQLVGRKEPAVFILEVATGTVTRLGGLPTDSVAASGPVWAPVVDDNESTAVVCPVWAGDIDNFKSTSRRLGLVFCFNRPAAMYLVQAPGAGNKDDKESSEEEAKAEAEAAVLLTPGTRSALWPRFSPDGATLVFASHDCAVESGAHMATAALHAIPWSAAIAGGDEAAVAAAAAATRVVVAAVDAPASDGAFPGLYMFSPPPPDPWIDGGLLLQTTWGAGEAIVHVDIATGEVSRITPPAAAGEGTWVGDEGTEGGEKTGGGGGGSWGLLDVRDGVVAAIHSDPASLPRVHVAWLQGGAKDGGSAAGAVALSPGGWVPVQSSYKGAAAAPAMKAIATLEYHVTTVLRDDSGAATVQSITVRPKPSPEGAAEGSHRPLPTIILPHGGPHASCAAGRVAPLFTTLLLCVKTRFT